MEVMLLLAIVPAIEVKDVPSQVKLQDVELIVEMVLLLEFKQEQTDVMMGIMCVEMDVLIA